MWTKVQAILDHWRFVTAVSALDIHRILDTIQYMASLVPWGQLHFWPIKWWSIGAWDQTSEAQHIHVPDWVIHQLAWWASPAVCQGLSLRVRDTDVTLFTDASLHEWGVQLGDHSISGRWSPAQQENHIKNWVWGSYLCCQGIPEWVTWQSDLWPEVDCHHSSPHSRLVQHSGGQPVTAGRDTSDRVDDQSQYVGTGF